ncbi:MAG: hypothetical protein IJT97_01910 [Bacteroidaceae bacterium]|nr:hypothetical protein [Bacteroidaceae bacterium]
MKHLLRAILYILCIGCVCSCSKENDNIPNLLTELCDVYINRDSIAITATLDDGSVLNIADQKMKASVRDTTIRSVVTYAQEDGTVTVYGNTPAICKAAMSPEKFKSTPHDPVKLISVWKKGKYINLMFGEMTTGKGMHEYAFCMDSLKDRMLYVSFIHKQPEHDAPSYTQKRYASMPLTVHGTEAYDSISLSIVTYDGTKTSPFGLN